MPRRNRGKKLKVKVTMVPTQGKSSNRTVEVEPNGTSVGAVLKQAGIDPTNRDLKVNGAPATLDTHVTAKDTITAEEARASVQVAERPQGS